jgi:hypothetical protein
MINKELAKTIFIDGQIIGARQMLNTVQGKGEREVTFEEYWETISELNESVQDLDEQVFRMIDKNMGR